ncbi:hypothetical protein HW932_15925 [Allochromatium humboldtianum]|uniref:Uncharacterized protein n=1 Tax=Allochromatium humboldtianum TaxID=504901 RepID=A0A850RPA8_9GAMM|nr:hypothetical protein [Allochromatium humboldtianum]NVZ10753.1 hypothetical protein [Allochromatium humboldtianum]
MKTSPVTAPEPITPIDQHTISKLSARAIGRMTYQIGVGESGTVYLAVTANEGSGYFSREWVAIPTLLEQLRGSLEAEEPFPTPVLRAAYVNRSINNAGFLAAMLRHLGLLKAGDPPHWHVVGEDWMAWLATQQQRYAAGERLTIDPKASSTKKRSRTRSRPEKHMTAETNATIEAKDAPDTNESSETDETTA